MLYIYRASWNLLFGYWIAKKCEKNTHWIENASVRLNCNLLDYCFHSTHISKIVIIFCLVFHDKNKIMIVKYVVIHVNKRKMKTKPIIWENVIYNCFFRCRSLHCVLSLCCCCFFFVENGKQNKCIFLFVNWHRSIFLSSIHCYKSIYFIFFLNKNSSFILFSMQIYCNLIIFQHLFQK